MHSYRPACKILYREPPLVSRDNFYFIPQHCHFFPISLLETTKQNARVCTGACCFCCSKMYCTSACSGLSLGATANAEAFTTVPTLEWPTGDFAAATGAAGALRSMLVRNSSVSAASLQLQDQSVSQKAPQVALLLNSCDVCQYLQKIP